MDKEYGKTIEIPMRGFTHGSKFHSDDVFATAFLKILNPDIEITRGFEVPDGFDGIVYDIGRGRYDHHQADKEYRENGCPYAAFGLIWREFGAAYIGEEEAARFDRDFVQPLDESDNTGKSNTLATIIDEFNPGWDSGEEYDACFWRAADFAKIILENHFNAVAGIYRAKELIKKAMEECDGSVLILPEFAPWKSMAAGSSYKFVVYPSSRGGYSAQGVPVSIDDKTLVCPFPEEWCGKTPEELVKITGIKTLRFCHPNAFLIAAEEKEDAVKAARLALKISLDK
ncbi:MAG: MYG1 family protein [Lachnospiraceae bacterium]|nr:MYG1 family protein [Lachnospiraceae bacterium]